MSGGRRLLRAVSDSEWRLVVQDTSSGVVALPTASFLAVVSGATVHLDGSGSFSTTGTITSWSWDFGDGATSTATAIDHSYTTVGTFVVRLSVTDSSGATATTSRQVTTTSTVASTVPTATLKASVSYQTVTFDGSLSTDPNGTITSYRWSFGDGTAAVTTTAATTSHSYATAGTYAATLTVTDNAGQSNSTTRSVTPVPSPVLTLTTGDTGGNGTQQSGSGIALAQNLTGTDFSKLVNAAGTSQLCSLQAKAYTFSNFGYGNQSIAVGNNAFGAQFTTTKGILGAGSKYTTISMVPNSSNKAGDVPTGAATGSASAPTNQLQYTYVANLPTFTLDGVLLLGTSQGHLYNGAFFQGITNLTISNTTVKAIPGNDSGPPGETFSVNIYNTSTTSVTTITNVTFDGADDTGAKVAAVGLGTNSTRGHIIVKNLLAMNTGYSAGWASWQQNGVVDVYNFTTINCVRSYNAERHGGTANFYDPVFCQPVAGHYDINYTWDTGYSGGAINFFFTNDAAWQNYIAPRSTKKITIVTTDHTGSGALRGSVNVYVGGVKQNTTDYVQWSGSA